MKELKTEIIINAKPEKIWLYLMDFESYPDWNPFIKKITGKKEVGGNLEVSIQPPNSNSMSFKPSVLRFEPNSEFRWKGKFIIKGIFDGEHYFIIRDNGDETSTFIQGEIFSGVLVGFFGKVLDNTKTGFTQMNNALKIKCETM